MKKIQSSLISKTDEFILSENNKLIYIYKVKPTGKVIEVISVSLNIKVSKKWETIIYYDSTHGYMHRHRRIDLTTDDYIVDREGVRQRGTRRRLLRWAIEDLKKNYIYYKRSFIKNNKIYLNRKNIQVDIY